VTSDGPYILLVDDEEGFRYAASKALENAGFTVAAVEDYRDALTRLERDERIDLLLTDIVMPNRVNGFALARMARLRRHDLKVLYITSFDVPTTEAAGKVIRKPITEEELVREVWDALARPAQFS
jgi:CheY-like chemotaxis protein